MEEKHDEESSDSSINLTRRSYLGGLTTGVSLTALEEKTGTVRAAEEGYGISGYGTGAYGDPTRSGLVGETGTITTNQPDARTWHSVSFVESYTTPVVIATPVGFHGGAPVHVRLRNVESTGFEFRLEEWPYLDEMHKKETIHYLVIEAGEHTLSTGHVLEAGTTVANHTWSDVSLSETFGSSPVVFSQSQTVNGYEAVITRQRDVATDGFQTKLQEAEGMDGIHREETVGYVAVESGVTDALEVQATPQDVTGNWYRIDFAEDYSSTPLFVGQMQTTRDPQPANLRYRRLNSSGVEILVQEERSSDEEMQHLAEAVGYMVLPDGTGTLTE